MGNKVQKVEMLVKTLLPHKTLIRAPSGCRQDSGQDCLYRLPRAAGRDFTELGPHGGTQGCTASTSNDFRWSWGGSALESFMVRQNKTNTPKTGINLKKNHIAFVRRKVVQQ